MRMQERESELLPDARRDAELPACRESTRIGSACLMLGEGGAGIDRVNRQAPGAPYRHVHAQFRALMLSETVPCIAGRSAFRTGAYWHGVYTEMLAPTDNRWMCADLSDFVRIQNRLPGRFSTFVASFLAPPVPSEEVFEDLLWRQLALLHEQDRRNYRWDPDFSADPSHPRFGFSIGGRAFFIVGLHPAASRMARRFPWPTLVFNAETQFDALEASGEIEKFQRIIRARDTRLQDGINPNLNYDGALSRAREYSGRPVPVDWVCPWRPDQSWLAASAAPDKDD